MERKYFGTDGIRGRVGELPISADFMLKLGWAAGQVLPTEGRKTVIIGKDTRISGYMFEAALEAGLIAAGVDIVLLGPMPTPAIAYLTKTLRACAGIVISASHNPHYDNGIKFFSREGVKISDHLENAIEAMLEQPMATVPSERLGKASKLDAEGRYIEFCKHSVRMPLILKGLKIVVDCANGATYKVGPSVFEEMGAKVIRMGVSPNGLNINVECGSTHPEKLRQAVLEHKADLGLAFDGDGDRVIMVDEKGELVDGDEMVFIIANGRKGSGDLSGPVVGTLMSNYGMEVALKQKNIPFLRAKVGDRYVLEQLQHAGGVIGGESSGHILCLDRTSTGDGIVSALQVIELIVVKGMSLSELKQGMSKYPQKMINVRVKDNRQIKQCEAVWKGVKEAEKQLGDRGRVLIRPSGTEPLVRVMVEGEDEAEVVSLTERLVAIVQAELT